jgi:predicted nucleic acid-binding protein
MVINVVDASAQSAILFAEAEGNAMAARLEDANLVAPALLEYEVANVCLVKGRRAPQSAVNSREYSLRLAILGLKQSAWIMMVFSAWLCRQV